jgi:hypothetical protein
MKFKCGDSNKKYQRQFFKRPVKNKGFNKGLHKAEQNRSTFLSDQQDLTLNTDLSPDSLALNVAVLISTFSR